MYITTLLAPEHAPLTDQIIDRIVHRLSGQGAEITEQNTLKPSVAHDIVWKGEEAYIPAIDDALETIDCDHITQKAENRQKKLLISDMDSTMINQECIDELADFAGIKEQVASITERAMNGELDFKEALKERVALLAGLDAAVLEQAYDKHITFSSGAEKLIKTLRDQGVHCVLVSGGFTFFTARVAQALGFHDHEGNELAIENNTLTGKVLEPIRDKHSKLEALNRLASEHNITAEDIIAIGDGANDLPMLQAAGLGIAYRAKPVVQQQTNAKLNHADLDQLLYALGIPESAY